MGTAGRQVFALVRRLHEELGVNSTCGASNVSFGLPNRTGLNGAFLSMAIASGHDLGDHEPAARGGPRAIWAADVMMGNDPDCQAWIARFREQPAGAGGGRRGGREGRRRRPVAFRRGLARLPAGIARLVSAGADALVVFTPSGQAGAVRARHEPARRRPRARRGSGLGLRRTRDLRAVPGRGERGRVREARDRLQRRASDAVLRVPERTYRERSAWRRIGGSAVTRASPATWSSTCRRRARCTARSSARRPTRTRSRSTPSCGCTTWRSSRIWIAVPERLQRCARRFEREWALTDLACRRSTSWQVLQRNGLQTRALDGHRGRPRRRDDRRRLAGVP